MSRRTSKSDRKRNRFSSPKPNNVNSKQTPSKVIIRNAYFVSLVLCVCVCVLLPELRSSVEKWIVSNAPASISTRSERINTKTSALTTTTTTIRRRRKTISVNSVAFLISGVCKIKISALPPSTLPTHHSPCTAAAVHVCKQHIFYLSVDCLLYLHRRAFS